MCDILQAYGAPRDRRSLEAEMVQFNNQMTTTLDDAGNSEIYERVNRGNLILLKGTGSKFVVGTRPEGLRSASTHSGKDAGVRSVH